MAIYRDKKIQCPKCQKLYESKYPSFIRVPFDNDIKEDYVSGDIHYHDCPYCFHTKFSPSPSLYVDDDKKIAVISNNYADAIVDREGLKKDFPDYKFYISETSWITSEIIDAIDNGFDPLVLEFIKYDLRKYFEQKHKTFQVFNSLIEISDDGYQIALRLFYSDVNGKDDDFLLEITPKIYNDYVIKVEKYKVGADESVISPLYIKKLYLLARNLEIDEAKQSIYEFLRCVDEYGDARIAFVQSFNAGKFKEGDIIGLVHYGKKNECNIGICRVDNIIHMTDYEFYKEINDLPVATYKVTNINLDSELDPETEINNKVLKEELSNNFKDNNYDILFNANVIVPMKLLPLIENYNENDELINKINFGYEEDDKTYYSLYLGQNDILNESVETKVVVNFKTVLKVFFNVANEYDGIIINPDTDKYKLSIGRLFRLITNRIMTNNALMLDFLNNISYKEIDYIGEDKYNLIKKVYSTNAELKDITEELNLSKDKVDYMLSDGYGRIERIIKSQELM